MATGIHKPLSSGSVITKGSVMVAFVFLFAGWLVGMFVHQFIGSGNLFPWSAPLGYRVGAAWQAYAGLFVLAAAIERLTKAAFTFDGDGKGCARAHVKKEFVGKKTRTTYTISSVGLSKLSAHLDTMEAVKTRLNQETRP